MRLLSVAFLLAFAAAQAPAEDRKPVVNCPGNHKNLKIYMKIHDVLFTQRDGSRVGEFYAPEVVSHNMDAGGSVARKVNNQQLAAMWNASKRNDPERRLVDDLILCSGDYIIVRTTIHAHDNTGFAGNPPTRKPYVISATDIYRFEKGKVVERWGNSDLMSLIEQVGLAVTPK
jgi:predicted ester cyclase